MGWRVVEKWAYRYTWEHREHGPGGQFDSRYQHALAVYIFPATIALGGIYTKEIIMVVNRINNKDVHLNDIYNSKTIG